RVGSLELPNPVMTAAGTSGHGAELQSFFDLCDLGAVVVKSLTAQSWAGNPAPRVCAVPGGMLNGVGLQGPGVEAWAEEFLPGLERSGARAVVSIWGRRIDDYAETARLLGKLIGPEPGGHGVVAVEVNVSCPNLEDRSRMFAHSPSATAAAVTAAAECHRPLWAKLSPNTHELTSVAEAALDAGAESVTLVNTLLGMAIDDSSHRPVLGAGGGGLSGEALHSVALRAVFDCRAAFPQASIVGVGGISDGRGALRMLAAGANAVQVGTATLADPRAPRRVLAELAALLGDQGDLSEIVAAAHRTDKEDTNG
ncbi:MAG TPA: dihydroorotate dehydrogenase, partial [Acidimicrobiales bacterium]|nr:dihydroorotate dehydrogenase [Acidimicrobiales bacterium]